MNCSLSGSFVHGILCPWDMIRVTSPGSHPQRSWDFQPPEKILTIDGKKKGLGDWYGAGIWKCLHGNFCQGFLLLFICLWRYCCTGFSLVVAPGLWSTGSIVVAQSWLLHSMGESSWIRDQIHVSCIGRWILYHWATREAPVRVFYSLYFHFFALWDSWHSCPKWVGLSSFCTVNTWILQISNS